MGLHVADRSGLSHGEQVATTPSAARGRFRRVSDYVIPEPEPKEIDEKLSMELSHLVANAVLKGKPSGDEKCENCRYYLESYKDISYCWHPKVRILVGSQWWCQWWEAMPDEAS